jgi:hypothetical protein
LVLIALFFGQLFTFEIVTPLRCFTDFYFGFLKAHHPHGISGHVSRSSEIPVQCRLRFSQKFSQVNI